MLGTRPPFCCSLTRSRTQRRQQGRCANHSQCSAKVVTQGTQNEFGSNRVQPSRQESVVPPVSQGSKHVLDDGFALGHQFRMCPNPLCLPFHDCFIGQSRDASV